MKTGCSCFNSLQINLSILPLLLNNLKQKKMLKFLLLLMDIPLFCAEKRISESEKAKIVNLLETGDIVLVADKLFPLWQLFAKLTSGSNYYHSAIYEGGGQLIEATTYYPVGSGVRRTNVYSYISGYKNCCVVRPPYASNSERQNAVRYAVSQIGKPYDYAMQTAENGAFYCTKLIAYALQAAKISVKEKQFLRKQGFPPDDFIKIKNTKIVYGSNENSLPKILFQFLCFLGICFLPWKFVAFFAAFIIAGGLLQFYKTPSNSVIRIAVKFNKIYFEHEGIKM
jgi:hypothetical protein